MADDSTGHAPAATAAAENSAADAQLNDLRRRLHDVDGPLLEFQAMVQVAQEFHERLSERRFLPADTAAAAGNVAPAAGDAVAAVRRLLVAFVSEREESPPSAGHEAEQRPSSDDLDDDDGERDDRAMASSEEGAAAIDPLEGEVAHRFTEILLGLASHQVRLPRLDELESYRNGGFGAVPASAAAVASLQKRIFHVVGRGDGDGCSDLEGCAICLDESFEEGQEISVMPCSQAHAFHTQCITVWLGQSNMCPLCRHALPPSVDGQ